ncbi:MAG: LysM peptidoglycan-binding domain-containing protein [Candidatus Levybacteria bacterium]|nr:LysM peptidoglycan-binding domain-containing protein [Candidatus Levybacteria bacterium]
MPTRKVQSKKIQNQGLVSRLLSQFRLGESYTNLILGAIVVIAIGIAVVIFVKDNKQETSSTTTEPTNENQEEAMVSSTYTVKVGDSLWSISEKTYNTGYNWPEIAKENDLENPGLIHAGNKLKLPSIKEDLAVKSDSGNVMSEKSVNGAITGDKYTIKKGDNLWDIAVRAYGDGFRYVEIAKANNLANPSLIHSDNALIIPRK